jgi:hypothetical protein
LHYTNVTTAAVSDIDESDVDMIDEIPAKKAKAAPAKSEDEDDDDEEAGDEEYNVEKILKHKSHKGQILYRIKWLGWDDEVDETWEPEENLYAFTFHNRDSFVQALTFDAIVRELRRFSEHITCPSAAHHNPSSRRRSPRPPQSRAKASAPQLKMNRPHLLRKVEAADLKAQQTATPKPNGHQSAPGNTTSAKYPPSSKTSPTKTPSSPRPRRTPRTSKV